MTPVEQAAAVYEREPCARSFREDLELHLLGGYVFSTPAMFIMGRAVNQHAPQLLITDPAHIFPDAEHDAWLVYLAAGSVSEFFQFCPKWLDFVMWERKNVLRTYYAQTVKKKCSRSSLSFSSPSFSGRSLTR